MNRWRNWTKKYWKKLSCLSLFNKCDYANLETKIDFIVLENNFENPITKILLTSDGIHEFLTNDQIHFILSNKKDTTLQKLNSLVTLSLISESNDNMSAILMEIKNDK
ncbi:PP2C family serine/threonine-protein phosphatase [Mycoplasmopsis cynos]|uniref:PP2C family serine/threonine-protein phosphatase n=1 Tax=Mycoplasmopsis cynos TaxID=171284 RepID=UPI0024C50674|nr:PP2C family serine/threonine-protein phosphatase [Mycoplasmopsis cynos]WAM08154.1 hypothetical protein ONA21_02460 [Mycoplasmopsis cynos]